MDLESLRIRHYPDAILRQVAEPVGEVGAEIADLAERMIDMMLEADGIGLAAPQVGVSLRLIVVCPTGQRDEAEVLVNPQLGNFQGTAETEEGCLSVPGLRAKVRRAAACAVTALDLEGNRFVMEATNLTATVVQHETDHLNGTLFIDRINTVSKISCRKALKQLEREFEGQ